MGDGGLILTVWKKKSL